MYILQNGPNKEQMCSYKKRRDSNSFKKSQGVHHHMFDIQCYFQRAEEQIQNQIETKKLFVEFVFKTNLSFRNATNNETMQLLNSFIRYGFSLAKSQFDSLNKNNLWAYHNRHRMRDEFIDYSNHYCNKKLKEFAKVKVHLSVDSSTINHIQTIDVVLLCNKTDKQVESLLYKKLIMPNSTYIEYKDSIINALQELANSDVNVLSIVSD